MVIGDGAVVAAGAVVVTDIPPYSIYGGVPAKFIRYRFNEKTIQDLCTLKWWQYDLSTNKVELDISDVVGCIEKLCSLLKDGCVDVLSPSIYKISAKESVKVK